MMIMEADERKIVEDYLAGKELEPIETAEECFAIKEFDALSSSKLKSKEKKRSKRVKRKNRLNSTSLNSTTVLKRTLVKSKKLAKKVDEAWDAEDFKKFDQLYTSYNIGLNLTFKHEEATSDFEKNKISSKLLAWEKRVS